MDILSIMHEVKIETTPYALHFAIGGSDAAKTLMRCDLDRRLRRKGTYGGAPIVEN